MTPTLAHTVDEALERFTLKSGTAGREADGTACAMTALAWVAGEAWTDHPERMPNLRGANLWDANLWDANLWGANRPTWLPAKYDVSDHGYVIVATS